MAEALGGLQPPPTSTRSTLASPIAPAPEVNEAQREQTERLEEQEQQNAPVMLSLANMIRKRFTTARTARMPIERRMLCALRQRNGEYDPDKLAQIREQGGSEIYMMLTNIKCRAAESWITDILFPPGDHPWEVSPTAVPDLPGSIEEQLFEQAKQEAAHLQQAGMQLSQADVFARMESLRDELNQKIKDEAQRRADRMSDKVADQLEEGEWNNALREFIKDVVTFPAGILKGPVIRRRPQMKWKVEDGKWTAAVEYHLIPTFYRVSPFDFYPSPTSRNVSDGYIIERHRLRRNALQEMKGVPGYSDTAIDQVLQEYGIGGLRNWLTNDQVRAELEGRPNEWFGQDETIDALEYSGRAMGKLLRDWGMTAEQVPDPNAEYEVNAWLIGNYVIRAVLNEDPMRRRRYYAASFEQIPGSLWGYGVPELMADVQAVCNAAARSLVNNMAISSGPMVEVYVNRLATGENVTTLAPWRIWQTMDNPDTTGNNAAVRFFQPDSNAQELSFVYDKFSLLADEYTGIPKYTYGSGATAGAGNTASGLSMLMSAASRGIKQVISHIDRAIEGSVRRVYEYNMLFDPDDSIKGDAQVAARGSRSLIAKEQQQVRRNEFLAQTANPFDMQIMGQEGRAELLREAVKSFDIDPTRVIPDREQLNAKLKEAMQQEMQQRPGLQPPGGAPGGALPAPPTPQGPQTLNPAGQPAGGTDTALFQQAG